MNRGNALVIVLFESCRPDSIRQLSQSKPQGVSLVPIRERLAYSPWERPRCVRADSRALLLSSSWVAPFCAQKVLTFLGDERPIPRKAA